jgi:phage N-6-adenine-methyltransferase
MASHRQRQRRSVHFRSDSSEWATPADLFARLDAQNGPFTLDPCATPENAKCAAYFTRADDGLAQPWTGRVFLNPPYGREIGQWVKKAHEAARTTAEVVVCLLPARTDTRWWHEHCAGAEVDFLPGRLRFGNATCGAPFPSAVVVFRNAQSVTKPPVNEEGTAA